ncbi:MAG: sulfatase, partial [Deltaproteobacteria bacterium]|nr:sulfatase [Deltaproteobacteria bacterium]
MAPMLDRRHSPLRRALVSGVMTALLGAFPIFAFELAYVFGVYHPDLSSGELGSLIGSLLGLFVGIACVLGLFEGLLVSGVGLLVDRLATQRLVQPRWIATIYTALSVPFVGVFVARAFSGRRARLFPAHHLLAAAMGVVLLGGIYVAVRFIIGARDRFRLRRWGKVHAAVLALGALLSSFGLYWADQRVLRGLYGFFHVALAILGAIVVQLAIVTLYAAWRPTNRFIGKVLSPRVGLWIVIVGVTSGAFALTRIGRSETLRFIVHEQTVVGAKLVSLAAQLHLLPPRVDKNAGDLSTHALADRSPASGSLRAGPRRPKANLLLITIDALRPDHLGAYGYRRPISPAIDALAADAVVFDRAYCPAPHTSFSMSSMLTGRSMVSSAAGNVETLATVLKQRGYKTASFFPPAIFYIDGDRLRAFRASHFDFEYVKFEFLAGAKRVAQVERYLQTIPDNMPFFAWVHFFEPHEPYVRRPDHHWGSRAIDRYDGEIAYVDVQVKRLVAAVRAKRPKTIIALAADHGEAFGEHGGHYHGSSLYEEQIHIPLFIAVPGLAPRRVDGPVQLIDLAPTLLSLVDIPAPFSMRGTDLGPWLAGETSKRLPPALVELHQQKAWIGRRYKLIEDARRGYAQLYDLQNDPKELHNLAARDPVRVAAFSRALRHRLKGGGRLSSALAAETLARGRRGDLGALSRLRRLARRGKRQDRREALNVLVAMRARGARSSFVAARKASDPGEAIPATIGAALFGDGPSLDRLPVILSRADLPPKLRRAALV